MSTGEAMNWQYRALALLLAFLAWYLVSGQEKVDTWIEIPVEFVNLPDDFVIRSGMVNRIQVRIRGASGLVRGLNVQRLAYSADLSSLELGDNVYILDGDRIPLSNALEVMELSPSRLELTVDKLVDKTVPVELVWFGSLDPDYELRRAVLDPEQVTVRGPSQVMESLQTIRTMPVSIEQERPRPWSGKVGLAIPGELDTEVGEVSARLDFGFKTQSIWVKLDVEPRLPPGVKATLDPAFVRLNVDLPLPVFRDRDWRDRIHVTMTLDPDVPEGGMEVPFEVDLPEGGTVLETKPDRLQVTVTRPGSETESRSGPGDETEN
jgi:hypothetical protein